VTPISLLLLLCFHSILTYAHTLAVVLTAEQHLILMRHYFPLGRIRRNDLKLLIVTSCRSLR